MLACSSISPSLVVAFCECPHADYAHSVNRARVHAVPARPAEMQSPSTSSSIGSQRNAIAPIFDEGTHLKGIGPLNTEMLPIQPKIIGLDMAKLVFGSSGECAWPNV